MAALIRMEQQRPGCHLAMAERPVEGLYHQGSIHPAIKLPADHTAAEQIDPACSARLPVRHLQIPPAGCGADVGDVTGPAAVGSRRLEVLLQQVFGHASGPSVGPRAEPDGSARGP